MGSSDVAVVFGRKQPCYILSSLVASKVVIRTYSDTAIEDKFGIITVYGPAVVGPQVGRSARTHTHTHTHPGLILWCVCGVRDMEQMLTTAIWEISLSRAAYICLYMQYMCDVVMCLWCGAVSFPGTVSLDEPASFKTCFYICENCTNKYQTSIQFSWCICKFISDEC